jgi:hypothetical protein
MVTFTMQHPIDCDCDAFWKAFVDESFNQAMFKALEFPEWTVLELKETDTEVHRRIRAVPKMDVPAAVRKLIGSSFGYEETLRFDKVAGVAKLVLRPNVLPDKMRCEGTVRCEPRSEGKCMRVVDIVVEAKIFGIGGLAEGAFEKTIRGAWQQSADFMNLHMKARTRA